MQPCDNVQWAQIGFSSASASKRRQQGNAGKYFAVSGLPPGLLLQACLHNLEDALAACQRIGYPIMLKASWGGGGKGIRKVRSMPIGICMSSAHNHPRMGQRFLAPAKGKPYLSTVLEKEICGHAGPER